MPSFRTELTILPQTQKLSLQSKVLTAGSCFAEVMGNKLAHYKVNSLVNPFGTIFNPISLFKLLEASLQTEWEFTGPLVQRDGIWFAYDLHSSYSAVSEAELRNQIQTEIKHIADFLSQTDILILTFGTAVSYVHKESQYLVANCHKIPQKKFDKKLLTLSEITNAFQAVYQKLKTINPKFQIIVTVSPVRHLKETLELNSVSKSMLRVACHQLVSQFPDVTYFPAYEIMLDDLRDYRFYKPDMIHPSEVAENYIWEKFKETYFDAEFNNFTPEWDKITQALQHKPFQPESSAHKSFLRNILAKLEKLQQLINCAAEIERIKNQL